MWRVVIILVLSLLAVVAIYRRRSISPATIVPAPIETVSPQDPISEKKLEKLPVHVLYGTITGTSRRLAHKLVALLKEKSIDCTGPEEITKMFIVDNLSVENMIPVFLMSTWIDGQPPESCINFVDSLTDFATDFRVDKSAYKNVKFAAFGLGSSQFDREDSDARTFCKPIDDLTELMCRLGATPMVAAGKFNDGSESVDKIFKQWSTGLIRSINGESSIDDDEDDAIVSHKRIRKGKKVVMELEDEINDKYLNDEVLMDVEELDKLKQPATSSASSREMVTPYQRQVLTKEGYRIIGSHSAVKLCRWTKNQLRGKGGCYKHSFYGISSYQCMELTPSLACANKCVFCWRHHKNPVGTEWRWRTDDYLTIVNEGIKAHQSLMKQASGMFGVLQDRVEEGMNIKHCALSLVGEPIMYPQINDLVKELHNRHISSFLVTNAQFPDKIRDIGPLTQLYVSIDAATRESLKEIDRPLFKDYWERYLASLHELSLKTHTRTVYRLTLIAGSNMNDIDNYAGLIHIGNPDFIEIKGVTFCGSGGGVNMSNVPWHKDVCEFAQDIISAIGNDVYGIACEHTHSCCVLIAKKSKYLKDGHWHTWIDYEKFNHLVTTHDYTQEPTWSGEDYAALSPDWCLYKSSHGGIDPLETNITSKRDLSNSHHLLDEEEKKVGQIEEDEKNESSCS